MRLSTILTLLTIFGLAVLVFDHSGSIDPSNSNLIAYNNTLESNLTASNGGGGLLWSYFIDPTNFFASHLWVDLLLALATSATITLIFAGVLRISTTDAVLFSPVYVVILAYGNFWIFTIFTFLNRELNSYMNPGGSGFALMPMILSLAFVSVIAVQFILSVLQSWRTGFVNS